MPDDSPSNSETPPSILDKPLCELPTYLQDRTTELSTLTSLFARYSDISTVSDEDRTVLNDIATGLGSIQKLVATLKKERHRLRHELECDKVTVSRLRVIKDMLSEQKDNIPTHIPQAVLPPAEEILVKETPKKQATVQFAEPDRVQPSKIAKRCGLNKIPTKSKKAKIAKTTIVPVIEYLTIEEFKSLPKYMLGRFKYEQINSLIDELNACASRKYKIIDTPLNKLSSENMKKFNRMTESVETKDTLDTVWFELQDIKDFSSSVQVVNNFTKLVPIFRHCKRLRQYRAGKVEKYVIV